MMRSPLTLFALLLFTAVQARTDTIKSTITAVTVHVSGAQVTRAAEVRLPKGVSTLVFTELSEELDPASVQVHGAGPTLLNVKHRLEHGHSALDNKAVAELEEAIRSKERAIQDEQTRNGILRNEEERLLKNDGFDGGSTGLTAERIRALNDYHRERITAVREGSIAGQRRIDAHTRELQQLHLALEKLRGNKPRTTSTVTVMLDAPVALQASLTIRYVVRSAGWSPLYDIRVNDLHAPLALSYKAQVFQSTGEDWNNVAIELSSGDPRVNGEMPLLDVWRLGPGTRPPGPQFPKRPTAYSGVRDLRGIVRDAATGEALPFVSIVLKAADGTYLNGALTDFDGYYAVAVPPGARKVQFQVVGFISAEQEIHGSNVNVDLQPNRTELETVQVMHYKVPLIDKDDGSSTTMTREQVRKVPTRSTTSIATTLPGVSTAGTDGGVSIRGGRGENTYYYLDGTKVPANMGNNPYKGPIDEVQVITGGIPGNYGDVTDGLINTSPGEVTTRRGSTYFSFRIQAAYSIPSDGQHHAVAVKEHELPSTYRYHCTPKLDPAAYLFAKLTGWDTLHLLAGPANLFFENTFIGQTFLNTEQVSDTLDISLGKDHDIVVQRVRQQDLAARSFNGNKRTETIGWNISVRNTKSAAIAITISDQVPVPLLSDISVNLAAHNASAVDQQRGMLSWRVDIPAASTSKNAFTYVVRAPRNMALVLE